MNRIAIVSMVKNEADIIESFVRYAAYLADIVLIADHSSSDGTHEILKALQEEGLPLVSQPVHEPGHIQAEVINHLYHQAVQEYRADLIIPLDADEFLVSTDVSRNCRQTLQNLSVNEAYCMEWWNYAPFHPDDDIEKFILNRHCIRSKYAEPNHKCMVGRQFMDHMDGYIVQGNHFVVQKGTNNRLAEVLLDSVQVVHFPWRSSSQYASKVGVGWLNNVVKYSKTTAYAAHYERFFRKVLLGEEIGCEYFINEPCPAEVANSIPQLPLRYTRQIDMKQAMRNIMQAGSVIAQQLCEERYCREREFVTVVIPFYGDENRLLESLENLKKQTYPWLEKFILDFTGTVKGKLKFSTEFHAVILSDEVNMFEQLSEQAKGKYVQWIFPGDQLKPEKIARMAVSMNTIQDGYIGIASDVWHESSDFPGFDLGELDEYSWYSLGTQQLKKAVVANGESLKGGFASLLLHRSVMEGCHWLSDCFLDGKPLYLTMWYRIFDNVKSGDKLGAIHEDFLLTRSGITDAELELMRLEGQILQEEYGLE